MYVFVDHQCRSKAARPETRHGFNGEEHIVCGVFLVAEAKFTSETFEDWQ